MPNTSILKAKIICSWRTRNGLEVFGWSRLQDCSFQKKPIRLQECDEQKKGFQSQLWIKFVPLTEASKPTTQLPINVSVQTFVSLLFYCYNISNQFSEQPTFLLIINCEKPDVHCRLRISWLLIIIHTKNKAPHLILRWTTDFRLWKTTQYTSEKRDTRIEEKGKGVWTN